MLSVWMCAKSVCILKVMYIGGGACFDCLDAAFDCSCSTTFTYAHITPQHFSACDTMWVWCAEAPKLQGKQVSDQDETSADAKADLRQLIPEHSLCWRAICIPGWMWRKVAVTEPVSTTVQLAGVCITLQDYGNADKAGSTDNTAGSAITDDGLGTDRHLKASDYLQAGRLRQQQHKASTGQHALRSQQADLPQAGRHVHVRTGPAAAKVTYTLVQQWGVEVYATILPVGWTKPKDSDRSQPRRQYTTAQGQPHHLESRAFSRLNSIWESHEGSEDEESPKLAVPSTESTVQSLFAGHPSVQRSFSSKPDSPGSGPASPASHFPNRQRNPLCKQVWNTLSSCDCHSGPTNYLAHLAAACFPQAYMCYPQQKGLMNLDLSACKCRWIRSVTG